MVAVENGKATVELTESDHCRSCGLCAAVGGRRRLVLDAIDGLAPGQTVVVAVERSVSLRSAFVLFGLPLAGLAGGALTGTTWPIPGLSAEASGAVLAVAGVVFAAGIAVFYDRRAAARPVPQPHIVRIESE